MLFPRYLRLAAPLISLVASGRGQDSNLSARESDATRTKPTTAPTAQLTCESRTINYITHTLPQQCLTSSPSSSPPSATQSVTVSQTAAITADSAVVRDTATAADDHALDSDENDLSTGAFMSFEEWKEMMLKKAGQEALEDHPRKSQDARGEAPGEDYGTMGEEGEITLDFDAYSDKISEITSAGKPSQKEKPREDSVDKISDDGGLTHVHRSKDAGKTCKERFSYSSFDAGASVLKTSPGAKNPKAILVENKDSYMLMECGTKNKFFIVELSDDVLVDTVVLANFEFFSSMLRHFRVSVSDRYPVKLDKWKVLGEYVARNSRDIQPFLIENPQIWARYLRIEILSHYGKEFYCPLSLIRVHGTRMLDSWKDADPSDVENELEGEEDLTKTVESSEESPEPVAPVEVVVEETQIEEQVQVENLTIEMQQSNFKPFWDTSYFDHKFQPSTTCRLDEEPARPSQTQAGEEANSPNAAPAKPKPVAIVEEKGQIASSASVQPSVETPTTRSPTPMTPAAPNAQSNASSSAAMNLESTATTASSASGSTQTLTDKPTSNPPTKPGAQSIPKSRTAASTSLKPPSSKSATPKVSNGTVLRNKTATSTSSSASASPTVQDSFFKQLTKRLQSLESNTTLSMQYIESQSKFLQEALAKLERRHASKVDLFLDSLNKTVMTELREFRSQYDQIWQSTIIALESQREKFEQENVALSTRMGALADEVVFQKRMAIVQSILLLGCLFLVVFGRGIGNAGLELYYPSQIQGSFSRLASPLYPATPKEVDRGSAQRQPSLIRTSVEEADGATLNKAMVSDSDTNMTPPRPRTSQGLHPGSRSQSQRNLLRPESQRPLHSRVVSDTAGLEFYQPPTPASLDAGYDSEPPHVPTSPRADYFSTKLNGDYVDSREGTPAENTPVTNQDHEASRIPTPASVLDDHDDENEQPPPRSMTRLPSSAASVKPLPALPEDSD